VAGYVPLGFLLALSLLRRGNVRRTSAVAPERGAVLRAVLAGTLLSLLMEALQNYLPMRVASNVDFGPERRRHADRRDAGCRAGAPGAVALERVSATAGSSTTRAARWCCWRCGRSPCCFRPPCRWASARCWSGWKTRLAEWLQDTPSSNGCRARDRTAAAGARRRAAVRALGALGAVACWATR
jgi:hypothetical protein